MIGDVYAGLLYNRVHVCVADLTALDSCTKVFTVPTKTNGVVVSETDTVQIFGDPISVSKHFLSDPIVMVNVAAGNAL
jgi:hypothetical protein